MLRVLMKVVTLAGLAALAGCDASPPPFPPQARAWLNQSEAFCKDKSEMSRPQCMALMTNGAEVAAKAIREGHERKAYLCVERTRRENGGYLDLVSAGSCIVVATWR
ncbi:MAG: hypothetical protein ACREDO_09335 [Methyloceanibacter sp.]